MHTRLSVAALVAVSSLAVAACSRSPDSAPAATAPAPATPAETQSAVVQIDGSSTVYPIMEAVAEDYQAATGGRTRVTVGVSGTGGGFKKFCRGELDIADASRPIQRAEMDTCAQAGIKYYEIPIAYDALTVVVNPVNPLASISIAELKAMWAPEAQGKVTRWNQVNPEWPDAELKLYGAGSDSGTFDYFTEAVVGKAKSSRGDYTASEDDNVLVQGIAQDVNALGYFGYAYYAENQDKLKALAVQGAPDKAAVLPGRDSVIGGTYMPLSRPLFVYVSETAMARPEVDAFVEYLFEHVAILADETRYVPLPADAYVTIERHVEQGKLGTVFKGEPATAVTIDDLLAREAGF